MSITEVSRVDEYSFAIKDALAKAQESKPLGELDPPLASEYVEECIDDLESISCKDISANDDVKTNYAAIETACRDTFYNLLSLNDTSGAGFGEIWNLLDIVSALSDYELCEPSLIFWLVEELLDSQTIDGCRVVFDYLDSRRDRLTAQHFREKSLVILRTCNELLRRLSRAEDTVFCGRVFIFLFQSFPLGDKSSVNLRGEYHVENVTTYESILPKETAVNDGMDIDQGEGTKNTGESAAANDTPSSVPLAAGSQPAASLAQSSKTTVKTAKQEDPEPDMDKLYETFWSLQDFFSQPTKLFDEANLDTFKNGLKATMRKFKAVQKGLQSKGKTKLTDDNRRGAKRKRSSQPDEPSGTFNPKYLTSRDLFDLEIKDLAFRRHIMVQTLIILDFLLSLNPKAKKKLENFNNRAVLYTYTLSDENSKWATDARASIAEYLTQGPEGKFYFRMVDTALSRDKNWTHWKAESCPPIAREPVSAEDFSQSMRDVQRGYANKRLKANPMGALDLSFLTKTSGENDMESLKDPQRYTVPSAESFERPIADDQFDIERSNSSKEKTSSESAKASKLWRTLRVASRNSLKLFDKFDDGKNLNALFRPDLEDSSQQNESNVEDVKEGNDVKPSSDSGQKSEVNGAKVVADSSDMEGDAMQDVSVEEKKQPQLEENAGTDLMEGVTLTAKPVEPPITELVEAAAEPAEATTGSVEATTGPVEVENEPGEVETGPEEAGIEPGEMEIEPGEVVTEPVEVGNGVENEPAEEGTELGEIVTDRGEGVTEPGEATTEMAETATGQVEEVTDQGEIMTEQGEVATEPV